MLRLNRTIRLTPGEITKLSALTDAVPTNIRTIDDLDQFMEQAKARFPVASEDREQLFCLYDIVLAKMLVA